MKVVILAAGIGNRLGPNSDNKPKCLLQFEGISLLRQHLDNLSKSSVTEIVIVYGYQKELIDAEIRQIMTGIPVRTVFNPEYTQGSVVSFWCARGILQSGEDVVLMDADVLYDPDILKKLLETPKQNCFLLDRDFVPGDEPVKLCIRNGQVIEFRKQIDKDLVFEAQGESVGFFRFNPAMAAKLADRAQYYMDYGKQAEPYEEVIRDLLLSEQASFTFEDITGLPWVEIDFPEDINRASQIMKNLRAQQYRN
ncbi:MAG: ADP-glucose pyrophosphorylase [Gammaproteobacteria bacterium]|nr:ADP-glucose pyrophosphorylase [Gammaproteobacteria bacterium]